MRAWLDTRLPVPHTRPDDLRVALLVGLGLFLAGWGAAVYDAVVVLVSDSRSLRSPDTVADAWGYVVADYAEACGIVVFALVAIRLATGNWSESLRVLRPPVTGDDASGGVSRWEFETRAFGATVFLMAGSFTLGVLVFPENVDPRPDSRYGEWVSLGTSWLAGPMEELVFPVALILLARAGGLSWSWTFVVLIAARVSFHVYYGWAAAFLAIWALGMILVYLATRGVLGMIAGHAMWNATSSLLAIGGSVGIVGSTVRNVAIMAAAVAIYRWMVRDPRPASSSAVGTVQIAEVD